jgi:hypothetical protein
VPWREARLAAPPAPRLTLPPAAAPAPQVDLDGIPALSRGRAQIDVTLEISALNEVTLAVVNRSTGAKVSQGLTWYALVLVDNEPDNSNAGKEILPAESGWRLPHAGRTLGAAGAAHASRGASQRPLASHRSPLTAHPLTHPPTTPPHPHPHPPPPPPRAASADLMRGGEATVGHGVFSNTNVTSPTAVSAADATPTAAWGGASPFSAAAPMSPFGEQRGGRRRARARHGCCCPARLSRAQAQARVRHLPRARRACLLTLSPQRARRRPRPLQAA